MNNEWEKELKDTIVSTLSLREKGVLSEYQYAKASEIILDDVRSILASERADWLRSETGEAVLKGERRRIIEQLREEVRAGVKADWLRSEIEKLEGMKVWFMEEDYHKTFPLISKEDIITRYKEELLELDKTSGL